MGSPSSAYVEVMRCDAKSGGGRPDPHGAGAIAPGSESGHPQIHHPAVWVRIKNILLPPFYCLHQSPKSNLEPRCCSERQSSQPTSVVDMKWMEPDQLKLHTESYLLLRNATVLKKPLTGPEAVTVIQPTASTPDEKFSAFHPRFANSIQNSGTKPPSQTSPAAASTTPAPPSASAPSALPSWPHGKRTTGRAFWSDEGVKSHLG